MKTTTLLPAAAALLLLLLLALTTGGAEAQEVDPCSEFTTCSTCSNAPFEHSCGFCQSDRQCRSGSMYGPKSGTCAASDWHPPAPYSSSWCAWTSAIRYADPCSVQSSEATCTSTSTASNKCGWCSDSAFGGGQCQKRNVSAIPVQPQWMGADVVTPVCKIDAATSLPAYKFVDHCLANSDSRLKCASASSNFGCAWCTDGDPNPLFANASCQAGDAAGFLSGATCAVESYSFPAAGWTDPCSQYSRNCMECSSAPAELNCGYCSTGNTRSGRVDSACQSPPHPKLPNGGGWGGGTCRGDYTPATERCPDACNQFSTSCQACTGASVTLHCTWCASGSTSPTHVNASCRTEGRDGDCSVTPLPWLATCPRDSCASYSSSCESCAAAPEEHNCAYCATGSTSATSSSAACRSQGSTGSSFCSDSRGWQAPAKNAVCPAASSDQCKQYSTSCSSCANAPSHLNCAYCPTGSSSSSAANSRCQSYFSRGSCSASAWQFPASECQNPDPTPTPAVDQCKQFSSNCAECSELGSGYYCAWCPTGSANPAASNAACQRSSSSFAASCDSGYQNYAGQGGATCNSTAPAGVAYSCSSKRTCSSCAEHPNCGWCADTDKSVQSNWGVCVEGSEPWQPQSPSGCPPVRQGVPREWIHRQDQCDRENDHADADDDGPADGSSFSPGSNVETSKTRAAFPLVWTVLGGFALGSIALVAVPALRPSVGIAAGSPVPNLVQRWAMDRRFLLGAAGAQFLVLVFLSVGGGVNTWSALNQFGAKVAFGVLSVHQSMYGFSVTAYYSCSFNGHSSTAQRQCIGFLVGGILTMLYVIGASLFTLLALIYAGLGLKQGVFSPRVWTFTGLALGASLAALLTWPLTSHLVLLSMMESGGASGLQLGASWGLMFPAVLISAALLVFWRAVLQTRPAVGVMPAGTTTMGTMAMASPQMFPANAQQHELAAMPPQQQQPAGGFVAPQPVTGAGGFAQV